jgi:hypothetical protein
MTAMGSPLHSTLEVVESSLQPEHAGLQVIPEPTLKLKIDDTAVEKSELPANSHPGFWKRYLAMAPVAGGALPSRGYGWRSGRSKKP